MYKVKLEPLNKTVEVNDHKSLFEQLKEQGININSTCGGVASCSKCIVKVTDGMDNMNDIPFEEKQILGNVFHLTNERLCCQLFAKGDLTLDISDHVKDEDIVKKKVLRRTMAEKNEIQAQKEKERAENPPKIKEGGFKRPRAFKYDQSMDKANKNPEKDDTQE
tara:strand:+ start:106451 stop:106942 length:492 start_codon:yes stop_codon:yes gene_type:complete